MLVDNREDSARETLSMLEADGGKGVIFEGDVTKEDDCSALSRACVEQFGRIDVLHNNVGIGGSGLGATRLDETDWQRVIDVNLTSMFLTCKHILPVMREQRSGSIINISSVASVAAVSMLAYKVSKAGVNALTQQIAISNAQFGIRANAILPGLINTPMAIEGISRARGIPRAELIEQRDEAVPLGKMGSAWDVASAALFLASDEAKFVTGVLLPVDGGQSIKVG
jgi:NAD(P)-dependent dehydrogenase (short-subunit alcohol dehydrogenase family)